GMFTWQVEAVLEGAKPDAYFVPVAIDYEKVVESGSYSKELAGGEKKAENLTGLLKATKVLAYNYGRIHLSFDQPISLVEFMKARGLTPGQPISDDQKKALVRALGNRVMYGISTVSTVTAHALASTALLAHRRRGLDSFEFTERVVFLRQIAAEDGAKLSKQMEDAPSDPTVLGPMQDAMRTFIDDEMVSAQEVRDEFIYRAEDSRRAELSFYKNTLMNLVVGRSLVANALLFDLGLATVDSVKQRALFLSRLFKLEFIYRTGATFDVIFEDMLEKLVRGGLITRPDDQIISVAPEAHARPHLEFLADLLRDYLEAYLLAAMTLEDVAAGAVTDKKTFVKVALETGRVEFLAGRISAAESLSRTTIENALAYLLDQKLLVEKDKKLELGAAMKDGKARSELAGEIRSFLKSER
ncbi:MAG: glycerol-3-phosphate acyltransferase, partial [Myxococcaceae bacterium]